MQEEKTTTNQPDFGQMELETLKFWKESKIFEKSLEKTKEGQPFIFYDGPPFATGLPHYGHILTSVIKDTIPRFQTMRGRYVSRKWGWDCHGLPIENIVEKKLGISGKKQIEEVGVEKFNQACRESVWGYEKEWGQTIERIARWVDFDNSYKTMDTTYQESVWWALQQFWNKGLIYEDRKVLLYCARCETPISNFEVAMDNSYKDVTENSVFVKFKLLPHQRIVDFMTDEATFVLAWTTTPWTLPANTALNIGPDITYVVVEMADENKESGLKNNDPKQRYILAKDRLEILEGEYEIVREVNARSLEGLQYQPLYEVVSSNEQQVASEKYHRIYAESYVTTTDGTGIVHNAAAYGEDDFAAAKRREFSPILVLDNKGHYMDSAPEFLRGKFFKSADKLIVEDLQNRGLMYKVSPFTHSYPHCHRCSTPLFYMALPSWFINIQKIKNDLFGANENINWQPDHLKHGRFAKSMEQAPDWNISRNRFWATALPFWRCQSANCKNVTCIGSVKELREKSVNFDEVYPGVASSMQYAVSNKQGESSGSLQLIDLHKPYIDQVVLKCEKCGEKMQRVPEVVDCWVESGSMPFAELHYPFENNNSGQVQDFQKRFPADFVVEYTPQTRAWFYLMHVMNTVLFGKAPFKNVLCHGTMLAEDGTKMSKSKGNYPDPNLCISKYGADALRFALLVNPISVGEDASFSENSIKEVHQKVNMLLYNIWQFYRMYAISGQWTVDSGQNTPTAKHVLDVWILEKLQATIGTVTDQLEHYNTVKASRSILDFINDLSTWYVRRSRDRIKAGGDDSIKALQVLGVVLQKTAQILAPFTPFISEIIYRDITGQESVHLSEWPSYAKATEGVPPASDQTRIFEQMDLVREIVSLGLSARKQAGIPVRQPLQTFAYHLKKEVYLSDEHTALILEELNVKELGDFDSLEEQGQRKGGVAASEGTGNVSKVILDKNLNEALIKEGLIRELERAVQDLRKKSGLLAGDLVDLYYNTQDKSLDEVVLGLDKKKLGTESISQSLEVEADFEIQTSVSNKPIWLGIVKK